MKLSVFAFVKSFSAMALLSIAAFASLSSVAVAQDWPNRAVKLVVPYPPGGGVDLLARALAQKLQAQWQHPVTVDNKPGANTLIGTEAVAKSTDGHTLLFTTDATFTINPHLYAKLPYDFEKDFSPIIQLVSFSQMLIANAGLPASSVPELIALAKSKPGSLAYASYGAGSQPQLAMETLKQKAGVYVLHIPYRGIPQAIAAVVGGEVPLTWSGIPSARPHLQSKRVKALAYGGKVRSPAFPDIPTMAELGFPEVDANVWVGLFGTSAMPAAAIAKVHRDVTALLQQADFRSKEIDEKNYYLIAAGPADFRQHIRKELGTRAAPIRYSGAKVE
jgi:tripartite-type tricarboxylate transporter receptor subunit TctC